VFRLNSEASADKCCLAHLVLGSLQLKRNVEAGMGMGGNGNELSGAIREWKWFFKCVNFGNGNGKDLAGMGGIGNTENQFRTYLLLIELCQPCVCACLCERTRCTGR